MVYFQFYCSLLLLTEIFQIIDPFMRCCEFFRCKLSCRVCESALYGITHRYWASALLIAKTRQTIRLRTHGKICVAVGSNEACLVCPRRDRSLRLSLSLCENWDRGPRLNHRAKSDQITITNSDKGEETNSPFNYKSGISYIKTEHLVHIFLKKWNIGHIFPPTQQNNQKRGLKLSFIDSGIFRSHQYFSISATEYSALRNYFSVTSKHSAVCRRKYFTESRSFRWRKKKQFWSENLHFIFTFLYCTLKPTPILNETRTAARKGMNRDAEYSWRLCGQSFNNPYKVKRVNETQRAIYFFVLVCR